MFTAMRRKDRQLSNSEAEEVLKSGTYGVLSMVGKNGYGYGIPLNYVYKNNSIFFHCSLEGQKLENISINEKVSFCVVGEAIPLSEKFTMQYKSVIVFGRAHEIVGEEKMNSLVSIVEKYSGDHLEKGKETAAKFIDKTRGFRIDIEQITGKASK